MEVDLIIDGEGRKAQSGKTFDRLNPVTRAVATTAPAASKADCDKAVSAAHAAFATWSKTGPGERRALLNKAAAVLEEMGGEFISAYVEEVGCTVPWAGFNNYFAGKILLEAAAATTQIKGEVIPSDKPGSLAMAVKRPVGVMVGMAPWNAATILGFRAVSMAVACGNTVVLKASEKCPRTHMLIGEVFRRAGFPKGVVNVITHAAEDAPEVVNALIAHPKVRRVNFTGSTRVGQQMIRDAAATLKKVSMELGGNAPVIVHDDADLEACLNAAVPTKFANAGQVCVTGDRFYVHDSLHDAFVDGFVKRAQAIRLGDGLDPSVDMGPLINGARLAEMEKIVAGAVAAGAKIASGGARAAGFNAGHFYEPTVLTGCTDGMAVMAEENFGPIAAITRFSTEDEVLARANAIDMGLSAYAFTTNPARARRTVAALKAGMVGINSFAMAASEAPFGGTNHSGMGREGGTEGIRDYLDVKSSQVVWA